MLSRITYLLSKIPVFFWQCFPIAFLLMAGAFINEFPLLTGDSAIYISSAYTGIVPGERPIFYGWFVRLTSFETSLWGPVFFQNFICASLLLKTFRLIMPNLPFTRILALVATLVLLTPITWETNKIMPDIFVAFIPLSLFLLVFNKLNRYWVVYLTILILLSAMFHNSHFVVLLLATFSLMVHGIIRKDADKLKKLILPAGAGVTALFAVMFSNYAAGNGFNTGKATAVFIVGKMCENGILQQYLNDKCPENGGNLCGFKDSLPHTAWQFVWSNESPVMKTGGWEENDAYYKKIIRETLFTPRYLWMHIWKSTITTGIQLAQVKAGDALFRYEEYDNTMQAIRKWYPNETNPALWTRQRILELDFKTYNFWFGIIYLLSAIILFWNWNVLRKCTNLNNLFFTILLFAVVNAFVTSNLANISSRLQARVAFLIPVFTVLFCFYLYQQFRQSTKSV